MAIQLPLIGKIRHPNRWLVGIVAAGVVGGGLTIFAIHRQRLPQYDVSKYTIPVESQPLTLRITASGTVQPIDTVNLSPRTSDVLTHLYVQQGDRVEQGQVIARMKSDDAEAALMQAKARVSQAQAQLAELRAGNRPEDIAQAEARVRQQEGNVADAQSRLRLATDRLERNRALYSEGAISQDQLDSYVNEKTSAQASVNQAQASLQEAQDYLRLQRNGSRAEDIAASEASLKEAIANLRSAEVKLEDTYIRAPFDGIITQKFATVGAFVTPTTSASEVSSATSSAIVAIASGLEVLAEVPEVDIAKIRQGQKVELVADSYPDQTFEGRVKRIAPQAIEDPTRGDFIYFEVTVELVTGEDKLMSGMKTDVTFIGDKLNDALVVPAVALVTQDGLEGVLVPGQNNQIRFQPVTIGSQVGNQIQILEGVDAGDRIFVELPPGQSLENLRFGRDQNQNKSSDNSSNQSSNSSSDQSVN